MSKLNALKIKSISKIGMHSDGNGLYLKVQKSIKTNTLNKSWIFRWGAKGANTMGLGSIKHVTLAEAREFASECHRMVARGINPRDERQKLKAEQVAQASSSITFKVATQQYIETHQASWKGIKHARQWYNTLETYAFDKIGKMACADVTKAQVLAILKPIWSDKHVTATRVRGRIESVLDWAIAKGYRTEANPAVLKGNLQPLLPHC